jgi:hypothetical protein
MWKRLLAVGVRLVHSVLHGHTVGAVCSAIRSLNLEMGASESDVNSEGRPKRRRACGVAMLALSLVLCVGGCCALTGLGLAANGRVGGGGPIRLGSGGILDVCAGVATRPYFRIGVGWEALMMSITPPAVMMSPYAVCADFPVWPAGAPLRGEWMFPP